MSRLFLTTSLIALLLLGVGAGGALFSAEAPAKALSRPTQAVASVAAQARTIRPADRSIRHSPGDLLTESLIEAGVAGLDAALADQALAGAAIQGSRVKLWFGDQVGEQARNLERLEIPEGIQTTLVLERQEDGFRVSRVRRQVDDTPVRIRLGRADGELASQLDRLALPEGVTAEVHKHLAGLNAASIDLIVEHEQDGSHRSYGDLLYLSISRADGLVRRWVRNDAGEWRAVNQSAPEAMQRPVAGRVTSTVGLRFHPVLRFLRWHRGTDFAAPSGAPVTAAMAGRVVEAGWRGGYGQLVRLSHWDGSTTVYAHLSRMDVAEGDEVSQGSLIGAVGATGLATGPHLHFEWLRDGQPMPPVFADGQDHHRQVSRSDLAVLRQILSATYRDPLPRRG